MRIHWAPILLADPSPTLRLLVLRELLGRDDLDDEVLELQALARDDPAVRRLREAQQPDGSWKPSAFARSTSAGPIGATSVALLRLGYLGLSNGDASVDAGAQYLFERQRKDGAWPMPRSRDEEGAEGYSMIPLQTSIPLRSLAMCGYATDTRAERAYDWLSAKRLEDGAWPTGRAAGNPGGVAGYRRLAHSRWGCRSNTTGALSCLALHPQRRKSPEARRALDLLLGRETHDRQALGFEVARSVGFEPTRGFITRFARFDAAQVLDLCRRIGATTDDSRVAAQVEHTVAARGEYGLWEYQPQPEASRWITFDLLRSLAGIDETGDWLSLEPRTPFRAYPRRPRRF